ncbi:MAG: LLM class F420-dependent oxidoreductase [Acidobacteriota bacterium]|nr:LLM class F420-dependent oxidoreductase [Acidobacteriota bacterium]
MKLGLSLGYSGRRMTVPVEKIQHAERLGYDSVWTAEAYGSDAITPLAYIGAITERMRLGTGIAQLAARTPANAAMSAATVDAMAGEGRFILGLGVSGPQIVEGWYGQPWGRPYYRVRDYVRICRKIWQRQEPLTHDGEEISLPFTGEGAMGIGKPLKSILHMNPEIPVWLATGTEAMIKLTGEIADGWLPLGFVPGMMDTFRPWLEEGVRRAGGTKTVEDIEIMPQIAVIITDDVKGAIDTLKPGRALYIGGMGHKDKNFHKDAATRRGYGEACERVQELYLAKKRDEAIAALPDELIDEEALIGPKERIAERFQAWASSGATGLKISSDQPDAIDLMAKLAF